MKRIVTGTVCGITALGFVVSYRAMESLAVSCNISPAWAFPLIINGMLLVSALATTPLASRPRSDRWFAYATLGGFSFLSLWAHGLHSISGTEALHPAVAFALSATPALALLASTHLALFMAKSHKAPRAASAPKPARTRAAVVVPAAKAVAVPASSVEAQILAYRDEHGGVWPTGAYVTSEWLEGKSSKTGSRAVAAVRAAQMV